MHRGEHSNVRSKARLKGKFGRRNISEKFLRQRRTMPGIEQPGWYREVLRLRLCGEQARHIGRWHVPLDRVAAHCRRVAGAELARDAELFAVVRRVGHIVGPDRETLVFHVLYPFAAASATGAFVRACYELPPSN